MDIAKRKLRIIEAVLKINNEATLIELEDVIKNAKRSKKKKPLSAHDFVGIWSKEEAEDIKKIIEESCGQIHPDDWK